MPPEVMEFFVRFLTDEGDLVFDPFAGSNTTGTVAEIIDRRWLSCEIDWGYAATSIGRFAPESIATVCSDLRIETILVGSDL